MNSVRGAALSGTTLFSAGVRSPAAQRVIEGVLDAIPSKALTSISQTACHRAALRAFRGTQISGVMIRLKHTPQIDIRCTRVAPPRDLCPAELTVLRELIEYQRDRQVVGSILLDAASVGRQAQLLTLNDGEHLVLLMQSQRFCYWESSREPIEQLHRRAVDWLTEPRVDGDRQRQLSERRR